jgi:hypothetical protein
MPLPTPILDDRSYQQLRDELVRRIPVYNPEWTDFNASDPGITLIELFAFLGENLLFRFNQIPDATRLAFLRLLGIPLNAAKPSEGLLTFSTKVVAGELVPERSEATAGDLSFETQAEVHALPLECLVGAKLISAPPATREESDATTTAQRALGPLQDNERIAHYRAEWLPDPAAPRAKPLDARYAVDGMIWMAVLETRYTYDTATGRPSLDNRILNVGFVPEQEVASMDEVDACLGSLSPPAPSVLWQASTSGVRGQRKTPEYLKLDVIADSTRGLTQAGIVRLQLPEDFATLGVPPNIEPELAGAGELPPVIDDEEKALKVKFWIRASRLRDRPFGRVRWMGINATEVVQQRRANPEFLGTGTGQPRQLAKLVFDNVIPKSLVLQVEESTTWTTWREVSGFEASAPDDRHFMVDAESGVVTFGNGSHGRPPQAGQRIRALEYRYGGGRIGNVPAKAINKCVDVASVKPENPLPLSGGADREALEAALERVPGEVRRHDRAVTKSDFEEIALMTPGADIGRAEALPLFYPPQRKLDAAGVVSVVVWPREDARNPGAPMPDRAVLKRVCDHLNQRRLITTELWVIPPTYRKIAVSIGITVKSGYGVEAVRRWVELVVRQFLAPLPPFGPEGRGWPLGRRVHSPEIEAAVLQVDGVAFLEEDPRLAVWDPAASRWNEVERSIPLREWEVPELWEITVVEGLPIQPGVAVGPIIPDELPGPVVVTPTPPVPGSSVGANTPPETANRRRPIAVPIPVPKVEC